MYKRFFLYAAAAICGIVIAFTASSVFTIVTVTGSGMEPALENGCKVLINKLACREDGADAPEVGRIIAFKSDVYGEEGEGSILVRRVAGSAGDVVEIKDNVFYLNGKPYEEYMNEAVHMEPMARTKLGAHEIFVLSDNRKSAMDSRNEAIGILDSEDCIGLVCFQ